MNIELIKLAHNLDLNKHYKFADFFTKLALDLEFLNNETPQGSGYYGKYYSNFTPEQLELLKGKLGPVDKNIGLKVFRKDVPDEHITQEKVAQMIFAPLINQYTDMNAPEPSVNLSFTAAFNSGTIPTQQAKGSHITGNNWPVRNAVEEETEDAIKEKLAKIGIKATDMHGGNFFVDPQRFNAIEKEYQEIVDNVGRIVTEKKRKDSNLDLTYIYNQQYDQDMKPFWDDRKKFDLSTGATILDFGGMYPITGTIAERKFRELLNTIEPYRDKSSKMKMIYRNIEWMIR